MAADFPFEVGEPVKTAGVWCYGWYGPIVVQHGSPAGDNLALPSGMSRHGTWSAFPKCPVTGPQGRCVGRTRSAGTVGVAGVRQGCAPSCLPQTGKLQLYDLASGALLEAADAHDGALWSLCLSPDQVTKPA